MKSRSLLSLNLSVILFGMAGLFAKWILLPSLIITFGRVFFSSITLNTYRILTKKKEYINKRDLGLLIALGMILAYHWWSFLSSIQLSSVAIGTVSYSTFPLFIMLIEYVFKHKKINKQELIEALLVILGVMILSKGSIEGNYFKGLVIGLSSSMAYALLTLGNAELSKKYESSCITCYEQTTAMLSLLPLVLLTFDFTITLNDILLLMILGIFMTALAHTIFVNSLKDIHPTLAGIVSSLESPYSILFALVFLHEIPGTYEMMGSIIIIAAVFYSQIKVTRS